MLGIIGRNGAGKTTLLKILSGITEPTEGRGAHPGPRRLAARGRHRLPPRADRPREHLPERRDPRHAPREIERKFDEIVAFAEVERFIDTPVKRYSSGMYLRLAFAVAAHLEPEILIVDEVLAVGDAEFQRKCLGKMGEVSGEGAHGAASSATTCRRRCVQSSSSTRRRSPRRKPSAGRVCPLRSRFYVEPNPAAREAMVYVRQDKRGLLNLDPEWEAARAA